MTLDDKALKRAAHDRAANEGISYVDARRRILDEEADKRASLMEWAVPSTWATPPPVRRHALEVVRTYVCSDIDRSFRSESAPGIHFDSRVLNSDVLDTALVQLERLIAGPDTPKPGFLSAVPVDAISGWGRYQYPLLDAAKEGRSHEAIHVHLERSGAGRADPLETCARSMAGAVRSCLQFWAGAQHLHATQLAWTFLGGTGRPPTSEGHLAGWGPAPEPDFSTSRIHLYLERLRAHGEGAGMVDRAAVLDAFEAGDTMAALRLAQSLTRIKHDVRQDLGDTLTVTSVPEREALLNTIRRALLSTPTDPEPQLRDAFLALEEAGGSGPFQCVQVLFETLRSWGTAPWHPELRAKVVFDADASGSAGNLHYMLPAQIWGHLSREVSFGSPVARMAVAYGLRSVFSVMVTFALAGLRDITHRTSQDWASIVNSYISSQAPRQDLPDTEPEDDVRETWEDDDEEW